MCVCEQNQNACEEKTDTTTHTGLLSVGDGICMPACNNVTRTCSMSNVCVCIPPYAGADCSLALRSETIRDTETQRTTGLLVIYGLPVVLLLLAVLFACCYLKCVGETEDFEDIVAEDRMVVAREKARRAESGAAPSRSAPPPPHSSGTAAGGNKRTQMIAQPSAADLTIAADDSTRLDDEDYSEDGSPMPHTPKGEAIALDSQSYSS